MDDEEMARKFHNTYERLAPQFGYETREETKQFDPSSANGQLMIAVCREVGQAIRQDQMRRDAEKVKELFTDPDGIRRSRQNWPKKHASTVDKSLTYPQATNAQTPAPSATMDSG